MWVIPCVCHLHWPRLHQWCCHATTKQSGVWNCINLASCQEMLSAAKFSANLIQSHPCHPPPPASTSTSRSWSSIPLSQPGDIRIILGPQGHQVFFESTAASPVSSSIYQQSINLCQVVRSPAFITYWSFKIPPSHMLRHHQQQPRGNPFKQWWWDGERCSVKLFLAPYYRFL